MIADIVGYSTRLEQDEEQNLARVVRSFELFRALTGDYGGEVVNVSGDGILALFEGPEQAVRFAIQVQNEFRDQAVWSEGDPILFRIGMAQGEVIENHGIYQGHCVNVAARLQTMADPGGIMATRAIVDTVQGLPGISFRPVGRHSLKNLSRPVEVFTLEQVSDRSAPPAAPARAGPQPSRARHPSVAVLALDNASGDPAIEHLAEGIVEDITSNLSRFRNLIVIARHSAFLFSLKTHSIGEIGERLGARYLLCGSLRRAERRLRIAVELIDTDAGDVVWSERFDSGIDEILTLQDEITGAVASRLAAQIDLAQLKRGARDIQDMRAYGLVLRGQQLVLRYTRAANAHARRLFEEAIEIAPDYGRAYSALSRTHNHDWRYEWSAAPEESLAAAVEYARRAILHDPLDARGYAELGYANLYRKRQDEAVADYARALALNPNDADIIAEYADALVYAEQPDKAIELMDRAMRLNPYYPDWYLWYLADAYNAMGRSEDVVATVLRMQNPAEGYRMLAANYAHLGMMEEARAAAREVLRLHPHFTIGSWRHRPPYRDKAIIDRYCEGMRKAGLPE
jgi:TolB-like protein/class 3 adenylate cyclase/Flp pilus assembly protein TadD